MTERVLVQNPYPTENTKDATIVTQVIAKWDFEGTDDSQLSFPSGAIIDITAQYPVENNWWKGSYNNKEGLFPINRTQVYQIEKIKYKKISLRLDTVSDKIKLLQHQISRVDVTAENDNDSSKKNNNNNLQESNTINNNTSSIENNKSIDNDSSDDKNLSNNEISEDDNNNIVAFNDKSDDKSNDISDDNVNTQSEDDEDSLSTESTTDISESTEESNNEDSHTSSDKDDENTNSAIIEDSDMNTPISEAVELEINEISGEIGSESSTHKSEEVESEELEEELEEEETEKSDIEMKTSQDEIQVKIEEKDEQEDEIKVVENKRIIDDIGEFLEKQASDDNIPSTNIKNNEINKNVDFWEACSKGYLSRVKELVEKHNQNVNAENSEGNTGLHCAALSAKYDVILYLLSQHANIGIINNSQQLPHTQSGCKHGTRQVLLENLKDEPIWIPDDISSNCLICSKNFTFFFRRHHCRNCGVLACGNCTNKKTPIPNIYGNQQSQRVCSYCYPILTA